MENIDDPTDENESGGHSRARGGPFELEDMERPEPGPGELLAKMIAGGVNPLDLKIRAGQAAHARHTPPCIIGIDLAGVVEAVGSADIGFAVGDEVFGMIGGVGGIAGSPAEFAAVDARLVVRKPASLSMAEAAALPLVSFTTWEGLVDRARVRDGQTVLVLGGGSGVGHVAVQVARACGSRVWAMDSPEKTDLQQQLGATALDRAIPVDTYVAEHSGGVASTFSMTRSVCPCWTKGSPRWLGLAMWSAL